MRRRASKLGDRVALFSERIREPRSCERLAMLVKDERPRPLFPCCHFRGQFRHDRTPWADAGLLLSADTQIEAAIIDHGRTKPHHVAASLAGVKEQQETFTHIARQLVMCGSDLLLCPWFVSAYLLVLADAFGQRHVDMIMQARPCTE